MMIRTLKSGKGGHPSTYPNTEEGFNYFREKTLAFLNEVKEFNEDESHDIKMIPDVESWCVSLGVSRVTLLSYAKERNDNWKDFINLVKTGIMGVKKDLANRNKIPSLIFVFDAVNNFDYQNTSDIHIVAENGNLLKPEKTREQLLEAIEEDIPID